MRQNIDIPDEFMFAPPKENDVTILVGENGSGKSFLLGELADMYIYRNFSYVIGIANSIHDKFKTKNPKFRGLRARRGRRQTKETLKNALVNMAKDTRKRVEYASRALEYVNYNPIIGFRFNLFDDESFEYKLDNIKLSEWNKEQIFSLLRKYKNLQSKEYKTIQWLETNNNNFYEIEKYSLIELFKWESLLVKHKVIEPIEVFLSKGKTSISLFDASSGELAFISTIIYIASVIDENTVILIDEPENSLHPKWQREYIGKLIDIFYFYQPKFIIATHSPLIISGAELSIEDVRIYKIANFKFSLQDNKSLSVEEIYYNYFDTTTSENRFLSELLISNLNRLSKKEIQLNEFDNFLYTLSNSIKDSKQLNIIEGVSKISREIIKNRN